MVRVLVCGDFGIHFLPTLKKLEKLIADNGPFELLLLTGGVPHIPPQSPPLPLPTFFASARHAGDATPRDVWPNLRYVGPVARFAIAGLNVVMVAPAAPRPLVHALLHAAVGMQSLQQPSSSPLLSSGSGSGSRSADVDVLLTPVSPVGCGHQHAAARRAGEIFLPRYHFAPAGAFTAHAAFAPPRARHGVRVIELCSPDGGARWVYAADIRPLHTLCDAARVATAPREQKNLYADAVRPNVDGGIGGDGGGFGHVGPGGGRKRLLGADAFATGDVKRRRTGSCWFCIDNELDSHLLVARMQRIYIAVAKGGLDDSHLVIVPVAHVGGCTAAEFCDETAEEMGVAMELVRRMYAASGMVGYFFERVGEIRDGLLRHMHVQAVAVSHTDARKLGPACVEIGRQLQVDVSVAYEEGAPGTVMQRVRELGLREFFWAELGGLGHVVVPFNMKFERAGTLPVHFGRTAVAFATQRQESIDWRRCVRSREEETALAKKLAARMRPLLRDDEATRIFTLASPVNVFHTR